MSVSVYVCCVCVCCVRVCCVCMFVRGVFVVCVYVFFVCVFVCAKFSGMQPQTSVMHVRTTQCMSMYVLLI